MEFKKTQSTTRTVTNGLIHLSSTVFSVLKASTYDPETRFKIRKKFAMSHKRSDFL